MTVFDAADLRGRSSCSSYCPVKPQSNYWNSCRHQIRYLPTCQSESQDICWRAQIRVRAAPSPPPCSTIGGKRKDELHPSDAEAILFLGQEHGRASVAAEAGVIGWRSYDAPLVFLPVLRTRFSALRCRRAAFCRKLKGFRKGFRCLTVKARRYKSACATSPSFHRRDPHFGHWRGPRSLLAYHSAAQASQTQNIVIRIIIATVRRL